MSTNTKRRRVVHSGSLHEVQVMGLSDKEVLQNRTSFGSNDSEKRGRTLLLALRDIVTEPMFLLLSATCLIYFFSGNTQDGLLMAVGLLIISAISFLQERKSNSAINALSKLSEQKVKVIRGGRETLLTKEDIVFHDVIRVEEGNIISADGDIMMCNDFSVNEAALTGESYPVYKSVDQAKQVFSGTMVLSGFALMKVSAVGKNTKIGMVGKLVSEAQSAKTPLQTQIVGLVQKMVVIGIIAFFVVVFYNYVLTNSLTKALLTGLTLAMSILPEEIPVAVTTFQALGAYRLYRKKIIVKRPQYVEALGSTTVICVDKTGTLTQNLMTIACVYDAKSDVTLYSHDKDGFGKMSVPLLEAAMLASEAEPFDEMEKSIHRLYDEVVPVDRRFQYQLVDEYPISGDPPFMTHVYECNGNLTVAAKGASEALIFHSSLSDESKHFFASKASDLAKQGMRVLGVGTALWVADTLPGSQEEFVFDFLGLIGFHDPPIENVNDTIADFYRAGVEVKMITGDYSETASAVAKEIGLKNTASMLSGSDISKYSDVELKERVKSVNIYVRMSPEAKLRVVNSLIANGDVVAMTGDGVNDAPALKVANVGIAMGIRGNEVAKNAAALIITDDNLAHMVDAIAIGRAISENIRKSIRYIISIHIPIILIVMLPLIFNWKFSALFEPVHIIFLEIIMGITCSIVYENEPVEPGIMLRPPVKWSNRFLTSNQLTVSVMQGIAITLSCLGLGYWFMTTGHGENATRSVVFLSLLLSNIFLTMVNRSFKVSIVKSMRFKNRLMLPTLLVLTVLTFFLFYFRPASDIFEVEHLSLNTVSVCALAAILSTLWIEVIKKGRDNSQSRI